MQPEELEIYKHRVSMRKKISMQIAECKAHIRESEKQTRLLTAQLDELEKRAKKADEEKEAAKRMILSAAAHIAKREIRELVGMKYIDGLTQDQIAEVFDVEVRTVQRWHRRAIEILREVE